MSLRSEAPAYFDVLIEGFRRGTVSRSVHLGHWDDPPLSRDELTRPGEFERAQHRLDEALLAMSDLHDGQSVLDVGCGFGGSLQEVNRNYQSMCLVGVNIDPRQLEICRQLPPREGNALEWVQADACHLPLRDASFDRVVCVEAMFHFASRSTFFLEAARILRPGGALVLSDMFLAPSATKLETPGFSGEASVEAILRDGYGPWPDPCCEHATHAELGRAAGLDCTRLMDATSHTRPSHRFTVPRHVDERRDPADAGLRAAMMLKWLHDGGHLTYAYMRFDKPETRQSHSAHTGADGPCR